jgi:hypothetical protein
MPRDEADRVDQIARCCDAFWSGDVPCGELVERFSIWVDRRQRIFRKPVHLWSMKFRDPALERDFVSWAYRANLRFVQAMCVVMACISAAAFPFDMASESAELVLSLRGAMVGLFLLTAPLLGIGPRAMYVSIVVQLVVVAALHFAIMVLDGTGNFRPSQVYIFVVATFFSFRLPVGTSVFLGVFFATAFFMMVLVVFALESRWDTLGPAVLQQVVTLLPLMGSGGVTAYTTNRVLREGFVLWSERHNSHEHMPKSESNLSRVSDAHEVGDLWLEPLQVQVDTWGLEPTYTPTKSKSARLLLPDGKGVLATSRREMQQKTVPVDQNFMLRFKSTPFEEKFAKRTWTAHQIMLRLAFVIVLVSWLSLFSIDILQGDFGEVFIFWPLRLGVALLMIATLVFTLVPEFASWMQTAFIVNIAAAAIATAVMTAFASSEYAQLYFLVLVRLIVSANTTFRLFIVQAVGMCVVVISVWFAVNYANTNLPDDAVVTLSALTVLSLGTCFQIEFASRKNFVAMDKLGFLRLGGAIGVDKGKVAVAIQEVGEVVVR